MRPVHLGTGEVELKMCTSTSTIFHLRHIAWGGVLNKSFSPKRDAVAALFQWSVKKHAEHYQNIWRVILFIFVICMFVPLSLLLFNFWLSC